MAKKTRRHPKENPTPKEVGRPQRVFNEKEIADLKKLMMMHCTELEIRSWFSIDSRTLESICQNQLDGSYAKVYEIFSAQGKATLRRLIYQRALDAKGGWEAQKWLSKQYLGFSDKVAQKVEVVSDQTFNIKIGFEDDNEPEHSNAKKDSTTEKV